jgi:hypothetical protein
VRSGTRHALLKAHVESRLLFEKPGFWNLFPPHNALFHSPMSCHVESRR